MKDGLGKVYVGDLLENVRKEELEKEFSQFGRLMDVWVAHNPPGFAFLEFANPRDAEKAVRVLDGKHVCGSKIRVEISRKMSIGGSRRGFRGRGVSSRGDGHSPYSSPPQYHRRSSPGPIRRPLSPPHRSTMRRSPPFRRGSPPPSRRRSPPGMIRRPLSPVRMTPPSRGRLPLSREYDAYGYPTTYADDYYDATRYREEPRYRDSTRVDMYSSAASWGRQRSRSPPPFRSRSPITRRRSPPPGRMSPPPRARDYGRERDFDRDFAKRRDTRSDRPQRGGYHSDRGSFRGRGRSNGRYR